MKVVFINGDAKKDSKMLKSHQLIIEVLAQEGIETEIINLSERTVLGCCGCYACVSKQLSRCSMNDDYFNECFGKMVAADGIILGSPPIASGVTSQIKEFLVRASMVLSANHILLRHKVGAVIFSSRIGTGVNVFNALTDFLHSREMIIVGANYWNMTPHTMASEMGNTPTDVNNVTSLVRNMAWLLKKIHT